jgi:hypothetical protein
MSERSGGVSWWVVLLLVLGGFAALPYALGALYVFVGVPLYGIGCEDWAAVSTGTVNTEALRCS